MSRSASLSSLYSQVSGLPIVFDNAKSHAPFQNPYFRPLPPSDSSFDCGSSDLEHDDQRHDEEEDEREQPPSPARGLARWGSEDELISNIVPKQPRRRRTSPNGSPVPWQEPPPQPLPLPPPPCISYTSTASNIRDTRIERIRSRWNSNIGNDEKASGKVSLSPPAIPRRCTGCVLVEDIMAPNCSTSGSIPDDQEPSDDEKDKACDSTNHVNECTSSIIAQAEGKVWKEMIRKELLRKNQKAALRPTNTQRLEAPVLSDYLALS